MYASKIKDVPEFENGSVPLELVTKKTAPGRIFFSRIFKKDAVARFTEEERQRCEAIAHVEMDALPNEELKAGQRMITRHDTLLRADRNEYAVRWVKAFTVQPGGENPCT